MNQLSEWIQGYLGIGAGDQGKILATLVVLVLFWALRRAILHFAQRQFDDVRVLYRWRKNSTYTTVTLTIFCIGWVWLGEVSSLSTFLGLLSAGLAIALQTPIVNLAGWFFIMWRRPFEVGDRIQIGETRGDVIDLRIFMFTMMEIGHWVDADQSTGRIVHIPNGKVFSEPVANYSKGFQYIWNELPVLITFESDWRAAKEILQEIANKHSEHLSEEAAEKVREASNRFMIFYSKLTPIVYTSVQDSGVLLTIRFLGEPRRRRAASQAIWEDILDAFAERPDIDFAYPTQRFYNNATEGKTGQIQPWQGKN